MPWLSKSVFGILEVAKDTVDDVKRNLAVAAAERDLLKQQLTKADLQLDFLRLKVNQLEATNAALMEKAYGVNVPVPEIARKSKTPTHDAINFDFFNDIGDERARELGLPVYGVSKD